MIVVFLVCIQSSLPTECQKRAHRYSELRSHIRVMHVGNSLSQTEVHVSYAQFSPRTNSSCVLLTQRNEDQGTQRTRTSLSPMLKFTLYSLQTMECHLRPIENTLGGGIGPHWLYLVEMRTLNWVTSIRFVFVYSTWFDYVFSKLWIKSNSTLSPERRIESQPAGGFTTATLLLRRSDTHANVLVKRRSDRHADVLVNRFNAMWIDRSTWFSLLMTHLFELSLAAESCLDEKLFSFLLPKIYRLRSLKSDWPHISTVWQHKSINSIVPVKRL